MKECYAAAAALLWSLLGVSSRIWNTVTNAELLLLQNVASPETFTKSIAIGQLLRRNSQSPPVHAELHRAARILSSAHAETAKVRMQSFGNNLQGMQACVSNVEQLYNSIWRCSAPVSKSASFLYVPRPKSFSYESRRPSTRPNSGVHPSSCLACSRAAWR